MRLAFFMVLMLLALGVACEEKDNAPAAEADAGVHFDRVSPTPHDVTKSNRKLRELKKGMQKTAHDRANRIDDKVNP